jgi:hypothetical protein
MQNKTQGDYPLELKFVDETRVYLNFWDVINGNDVCCQIKDGKLHKFVHTPMEVEADEVEDTPKIQDAFEQTEISLNEFLELVQGSILKQS